MNRPQFYSCLFTLSLLAGLVLSSCSHTTTGTDSATATEHDGFSVTLKKNTPEEEQSLTQSDQSPSQENEEVEPPTGKKPSRSPASSKQKTKH